MKVEVAESATNYASAFLHNLWSLHIRNRKWIRCFHGWPDVSGVRALAISLLLTISPICSFSQASARLVERRSNAASIVSSCGVNSAKIFAARVEYRRETRPADGADIRSLLQEVHQFCTSGSTIVDIWIEQDISDRDYEEATSLISAEQAWGNRANLHTFAYMISKARHNYRAAATEAQMAAQLDPTEANIFNYGSALEKLDYPSAEKVFAYGVKRYPESPALRMGLAGVLLAETQYEEGIRTLIEAYQLDPGDPRPMELLAEFQYVPASQRVKVQDMFAELKQRFPRNGRLTYGFCMISFGRWNTPIRWASSPGILPGFEGCMRSALKEDPTFPSAYFQLALALQAAGKNQAAVTMFEKAVALRPNDGLYRYRLAFCYKSVGNITAFKRELERFRILHAKAER